MAQQTMVSVVSPVYNNEDFIRDFVESIQAQTLKEWELICVDDGSEDRSVEILAEYEKQDPRVRCIRAPHTNAGVARNLGMAEATGKYICFLDSDDMPRPAMLETMSGAAEKYRADVVLCDTSSYSMKTGEETPMPWSIRWHLLPEMKDGVFSRNDAPDRLFQLFIVSPWNKMYRRQLLVDNGIQAQSQIAANDVVLTMSALACAERICPIHENLYVQRRDNVNSITGNLNTTEKHMCGYTSSLGLKEALERLGLYERLQATYQILAIHNVLWYLEKQRKQEDVYVADYDFLHREGLKNLGLEKLTADAQVNCPSKELQSYIQLRSMTFYKYMMTQLQNAEAQIKKLEGEIQRLNLNRAMKVSNAIRRTENALRMKPKLLMYSRITRQERAQERILQKGKQKRICILAFETYHYNVVENMVRICNPLKNYVEVRAIEKGIKEIGAPLEKEIREAVCWKNTTVSIPGVTPDEAKYIIRQRQDTFVRDAARNGCFDMVLVPSPEFHPDWYQPLLDNQSRDYQVIAGVHNLNDALLSPNAPRAVRAFYEQADGYAVIYRFLADRMKELGYDKKPILVFPQLYLPRPSLPHDTERIRFVVTGSVDPGRKDYEQLAEAFEMVKDLHPRMSLELAGAAGGDYGAMIRHRFLAMQEESGLEFIYHKSFMPFEVFEQSMDQADFLVAPVVTDTVVRGIREVYGQTKISGVQGDMIKFACPAVVVETIRMSDDLASSVLSYRTTEELAAQLRKCVEPGVRERFRAEAAKNSQKFLPEKVVW